MINTYMFFRDSYSGGTMGTSDFDKISELLNVDTGGGKKPPKPPNEVMAASPDEPNPDEPNPDEPNPDEPKKKKL